MKSLGLRHAALNVRNARKSKEFYVGLLGMTVEWEPDLNNVYLTTGGQDNLALHQTDFRPSGPQAVNHIGFIAASPDDVDETFREAVNRGLTIVRPPKRHRDGAYSFYLKDPDGVTVQVMYHPPIAGHFPGDDFSPPDAA